MIRSIFPLLVLCLVSPVTMPSVAGAVPQADLGQPIDLELRKADLVPVLESFARIAGGELDIDPEIEGDVTVDWKSIPWKQALDRLCRTHRISCYWSDASDGDSEPSKLIVRRSDGFVGAAESIDMELRQAPIGIVLQAMDSIAGETFRVEVDPKLDGAIDVQLSSTPWPEALESICRPGHCRLTWSSDAVLVEPGDGSISSSGVAWKVSIDAPSLEHRVAEVLDAAGPDRLPYAELDALCKEVGCDWTVRWAETPLLVITAGEAEPPTSKPASEPKFGKDPVVLNVSVSSGGVRTSRAFAFGWDSPSHRLEPAADGDAPAVRLTWIPFSAHQQVLVAYGIRCEESGAGRYETWDPVALPLDGTWQASFGEARVEIRATDSHSSDPHSSDPDSSDPDFSSGEPSGQDPVDDEPTTPRCADEAASFQMALRREDQPAPKGMSSLPTRPGNYLMVTPRGEPGPAAALVYLGPNADGTKALALVLPASETAKPSIQRFDLAPGDTWTRPVTTDGSGRPSDLRMYVTVGPDTESYGGSAGAGE